MANIKFRPEIDSLRCLAVIAVITYHMNSSILPSGFVGVDIFLVISGYLITSIILKTDHQGNNKLSDFYLKRVKRILPLTYVVIFTSLLFGYALSSPSIYKAEAHSAFSAMLFIANFRFSLMGDYFGGMSNSPLLHLWSLSLEEQFYIIWPMLIISVGGLKKRTTLGFLVGILLIISIALAQYSISDSRLSTYAYFMLPTRMIGLLIGAFTAILILCFQLRISSLYSLIGVVMISSSLFLIDPARFPGIISLIPCVGVSLVILSRPAARVNDLLSNKVALYIGKISFSLYMWHWPMLVFINRVIPEQVGSNLYASITYVFTLLLVSSFSYYLIEEVFRRKKVTVKQTLLFYLLLPSILLTVLSYSISINSGLPQRYGLTDKMTQIETLGCHGIFSDDNCFLSKSTGYKNVLLGDSHAGSLNNFFRKFSTEYNHSLIGLSAGGCLFFSVEYFSEKCEIAKEKLDTMIDNEETKNFFIVFRFDSLSDVQLDHFIKFINNLLLKNKRVIIVKQVPLLGADVKSNSKFLELLLNKKIGVILQKKDADKAHSYIESMYKSQKNVLIIDPALLLVDDNQVLYLDKNGSPLYYDDNHLNAFGAEWLFDQYRKQPEKLDKINQFLKGK